MICLVINTPCKTNGCGNKCYKLHTLDSGYKVHEKYDSQPEGFKKLKEICICVRDPDTDYYCKLCGLPKE